jgi:hypothetical protein
MAVLWTHHASLALEKRGLAAGEIVTILSDPSWSVADPNDPTLMRAFGKISSANHWIRIVFRQINKDDKLVVTVHPDRDAVPPNEGKE